jgi:hypothetical protein
LDRDADDTENNINAGQYGKCREPSASDELFLFGLKDGNITERNTDITAVEPAPLKSYVMPLPERTFRLYLGSRSQ